MIVKLWLYWHLYQKSNSTLLSSMSVWPNMAWHRHNALRHLIDVLRNFWIFGNVATMDQMALLASFSTAITELQLKLAHNINVIVLRHSLYSLIGPVKSYQRHLTNRPKAQRQYKSKMKIERKFVGGQSQSSHMFAIHIPFSNTAHVAHFDR